METANKIFKCWFDGSCGPQNPFGEMGLGVVIKCEDKDVFIHSSKIPEGPNNSNNVAEYMAFIKILEFLITTKSNRNVILVYGDSNLVVQQMSGYWRIKHGMYKEYALKAKEMMSNFPNIRITWIPREQNTICDDLSKNVIINYEILPTL